VLIPSLDARSSDLASRSRFIVILSQLLRHLAPSTYNIFSLEAAIDQAGLSVYIFLFSFFFFFSSQPMSSFEAELCRQGLLEDLDALPALAVLGRVPSTTGGLTTDPVSLVGVGREAGGMAGTKEKTFPLYLVEAASQSRRDCCLFSSYQKRSNGLRENELYNQSWEDKDLVPCHRNAFHLENSYCDFH
jgi:hypothetical protein